MFQRFPDGLATDRPLGVVHILGYIKNVDNLKYICIEYDDLSGPERQEWLFEFLGLFARRDAIREKVEQKSP